MADEKGDNSNARSQLKAQGTNHSGVQSSSRSILGHHEIVSASYPNALPPQSPPATTSPTSPKSPIANLESQSMTTTSTSIPSGQGRTAMDANGPSPYGTRSRNRTGNSRPNYAEDRDLEDYDWHMTKKSHISQGSATAVQLQTGDSEKSSGVNTRRSSTTASGTGVGKVAASTTPKEHIPGMSSFSITPEAGAPPPPPPTKKRKAPNGGHVNSNGSASSSHAPNHSRKHPNLPAVAVGFRETNMMSFESSQGYLRHGKLRADDGTMLGVDGMLNFPDQD